MTVLYDILGHEGSTLWISAQKNNFNYVKQVSHSRLGLKTLFSHGLKYADFIEASTTWFSKDLPDFMQEYQYGKFIIWFNGFILENTDLYMKKGLKTKHYDTRRCKMNQTA